MRQLMRVLATVVPALHRWLGGRAIADPEDPAEDQENVYPLW